MFDTEGCHIFKNDKVTTSGGLYNLRTIHDALRVSDPSCLHSWHRILEHRKPNAIRDLESKKLATGIHIKDCGCYETCEC